MILRDKKLVLTNKSQLNTGLRVLKPEVLQDILEQEQSTAA